MQHQPKIEGVFCATRDSGHYFRLKNGCLIEAMAPEKKWDLTTMSRNTLESTFSEFAKVSTAETKRADNIKEK